MPLCESEGASFCDSESECESIFFQIGHDSKIPFDLKLHNSAHKSRKI